MVYTFQTVLRADPPLPGPSPSRVTFFEGETYQRMTVIPLFTHFWCISISKDAPKKLMSILIETFPKISAFRKQVKKTLKQRTQCRLSLGMSGPFPPSAPGLDLCFLSPKIRRLPRDLHPGEPGAVAAHPGLTP